MLNARLVAGSCAAVALIFLAAIGWAGEGDTATDGHHPEILREEAAIRVHGVAETWQLLWADMPSPICDADDMNWTTPAGPHRVAKTTPSPPPVTPRV